MSSVCRPAPRATERPRFAMPGMPRPAAAGRFSGRDEPRLQEILDDPIIHRLMASDGVPLDHLLGIIAEARRRLGH